MSAISITGVVKAYGGLRPLRVRALAIDRGEIVTIAGPDHVAAAVLTDLLTGTILPDEGEVRIDGRATSELSGHDEWLAFLERFGIVNQRVVLLDALSVAQNLAVPLTLDLDPLGPDTRRAVEALAAEVGLDPSSLDLPLSHSTSGQRLAVRLGRALALGPHILIVEHPSAGLEHAELVKFAAGLRHVATDRRLAVLVVTTDANLPSLVATRALAWRAATGDLRAAGGWRFWRR
ncbi:MAG TPA: ATP-binding cassette domain-containing protein [Vicinamibacterales bacterium]